MNCVTKDGSLSGIDKFKNPFANFTNIPVLIGGGFREDDFKSKKFEYWGILTSSYICLNSAFKPFNFYPERYRVN